MRRFFLLLAVLLALLIPVESFAGPFMVLPKRGSAWSKTWLTGWDYRKEFTATRESGAVTDYQVRLQIGSYVISSCEDTTGWSAPTSTLATDTGHEGTNAITITSTSDDGYAYLSFSESDWREARNIVFWHKRSGTAETTGEVYIFDANNDYVSWNFSMSDDWTEQVIDTTSTPDSSSGTMDWDRIVKMRFDANAEGTVLYVDYIQRNAVDCEGHCLSTFNDLRFTNSDGDLLSYYIESISGTTPNQIATVWVKLDYVGTSATKFYMYYGNSGASAASNGTNTFHYYNDFESDTIGNAPSGFVSNTNLVVYADTVHGSQAIHDTATTNNVFDMDDIQNMRVIGKIRQYATTTNNRGRINVRVGGSEINVGEITNNSINIYEGANQRDAAAFTWGTNWHSFDIRIEGTTIHAKFDSTEIDYSSLSGSTAGKCGIQTWVENSQFAFDAIAVGKYSFTEPVVGSWGSEES